MNEQAELIRLGEQFQHVREQQGVSVAELAARTDISERRISSLEAGRLDPAYDVLIALADGMGVRASALIPKDWTRDTGAHGGCPRRTAVDSRRADSYPVEVDLGDREAVRVHDFEVCLDRLSGVRARFLDRLALSGDTRQFR